MMQAMRGEDFRARTKVSTHQLPEVLMPYEGAVRRSHRRTYVVNDLAGLPTTKPGAALSTDRPCYRFDPNAAV